MTKVGLHVHRLDDMPENVQVDVIHGWDSGQPLWYDTEKEIGVYDPQPWTNFFAKLRGRKAIIVIGPGTPAFYARSMARKDRYGVYGGASLPTSWRPLQAFVAWLHKTFGRYIEAYIFYNEPDGFVETLTREWLPEGMNPDWTDLATGYSLILDVLPSTVMVYGPAMLGGRPDDTQAFIDAMPGRRKPRGVAVNLYDRSAEQLHNDLATLRRIVGVDMPICISEFGVILEYTVGQYEKDTRWGKLTPQQQGQEFTNCWRACQQWNVDYINWYSLDDKRGVVLASVDTPIQAAINAAAISNDDEKETSMPVPIPTLKPLPAKPAAAADFDKWVAECNVINGENANLINAAHYANYVEVNAASTAATAALAAANAAMSKQAATGADQLVMSNSLQAYLGLGKTPAEARTLAKADMLAVRSGTKPPLQPT